MQILYRTRDITKYDDIWWWFLSKEDLDNIDNDNEVDDDVGKSSSHNKEMKKIFKIGKKEVDELRGRTNTWMIL